MVSGYRKKGADVALHQYHGTRIPDAKISNIYVDVKTLLITGKNRKKIDV